MKIPGSTHYEYRVNMVWNILFCLILENSYEIHMNLSCETNIGFGSQKLMLNSDEYKLKKTLENHPKDSCCIHTKLLIKLLNLQNFMRVRKFT